MEMEKSLVVTLIMAVATLVIGVHGVNGWKDDKVTAVHIGGKVLCQDCTKDWNHWAYGATSLKGCRVSVTCMDERKRVVYHANDETDEQGEFELMVSRYMINGKVMKPQGCLVRLVSSPHPECSIATDFGKGKSGAKLGSPSHVYPGLVKYTVGPFYFTSPMCDEPDTSSGSDDGDGRY
ncbi:hypothetical protein J5N97_024038 [Dioscorea zingiberensis]|uniref:Pollen Ole e 1 allergen and extensin family protein n=1 Tax=Dioscorea zingiberensis TaxID=325984 RepID=A0A9D5C5P6_9LILI|nr:hypothetical protein J5N97_024038 [Dioscorea zingiberensis]